MWAPLDEEPASDRCPGVALGRAPHRQRQAPAWAQDTACFGEGRGGVRHQHVAALAEHSVDRVVVEVDRLGVHHAELDVLDALLRAVPARDIDHVRGEVGRDEPTLISDDPSYPEAEVAGAARELEHGIAGPRLELPDQPVVHRRDGLA